MFSGYVEGIPRIVWHIIGRLWAFLRGVADLSLSALAWGVIVSFVMGSTVPGGQLINTTPKAANLYTNPCLPRLSPRHIVRSIPADLCALFGVKAAKNQEYLILIQVVKFMWLRCICADKWLYTAVYLYFSINDKAGNN